MFDVDLNLPVHIANCPDTNSLMNELTTSSLCFGGIASF